MSGRVLNLTGQRFGKLVAIERCENDKHGKARWLCRCDCGTTKKIVSNGLMVGDSKSCGCSHRRRGEDHHRYIHGGDTEIYGSWSNMLDRCRNSNNPSYHNYGGRGIKVCLRWYDFMLFAADMGERPSPNHSIERLDVNGNYEIDNCVWATAKDQARNTRANIKVRVRGATVCLAEAVEKSGVSYSVAYQRFRSGKPISEVLRVRSK